MSAFTAQELSYLTSGRHLGRLATVGHDGFPHVVPVGWSYNAQTDTIDVTGRNFAATRKFRNARANPQVAIVIDEVLPPWRPRSVMVQGHAGALVEPTAMIRITPVKVISWGLDEEPI